MNEWIEVLCTYRKHTYIFFSCTAELLWQHIAKLWKTHSDPLSFQDLDSIWALSSISERKGEPGLPEPWALNREVRYPWKPYLRPVISLGSWEVFNQLTESTGQHNDVFSVSGQCYTLTWWQCSHPPTSCFSQTHRANFWLKIMKQRIYVLQPASRGWYFGLTICKFWFIFVSKRFYLFIPLNSCLKWPTHFQHIKHFKVRYTLLGIVHVSVCRWFPRW